MEAFNPFDIWPDANKQLRERNWDALNPRSETFKERQAKEEKERQLLASALWKRETDSLRVHKNYLTGDMDAFHEGACCGGCYGEREEGYSGGGMYCCCYEGLTPLEQWGNPVQYPLVDSWFPPEFVYFGDKTRERYYQRFAKELATSTIMDTYTRPDRVLRVVTDIRTGRNYAWNI